MAYVFVDDHPAPAVHRPLPDLCAAYPAGSAMGSPARPVSRTLDRNAAQCTFSPTSGNGLLIVRAHRPEPGRFSHERAEARREFRDTYDNPDDGGASAPVAGVGEEAKAATVSDASRRRAQIVVRDGLLIVEVIYELPDSPRTDVATVRATAQRVATELLKILPPGVLVATAPCSPRWHCPVDALQERLLFCSTTRPAFVRPPAK